MPLPQTQADSEKEINSIAQFCQGGQKFTIQNFRNNKVLDPSFQKYQGFSKKELNIFKKVAEKHITKVEIQI